MKNLKSNILTKSDKKFYFHFSFCKIFVLVRVVSIFMHYTGINFHHLEKLLKHHPLSRV